jgi:hypothetical protein
MQYKIKFFGLKSAAYNIPLHINQQLVAAQTPAAILNVIVDNGADLTRLFQQDRRGYHYSINDPSGSETVAELMSDVLTSKRIEHSFRIAEDLGEQGHKVLYYVEVDGVSYHYPFEAEPFDEEAIDKQVEKYLATKPTKPEDRTIHLKVKRHRKC